MLDVSLLTLCECHPVVIPLKIPSSRDSPNFYSVISFSELEGESDSEVNFIFLMDNSNYNGPNFELSKRKVTWLSSWNSWDQIPLSYGNHASLTELAEHCLSKEKRGNKNGIALPKLSLLGQNFSCINPINSMELHPFLFWLSTHPTEISSRSLE